MSRQSKVSVRFALAMLGGALHPDISGVRVRVGAPNTLDYDDPFIEFSLTELTITEEDGKLFTQIPLDKEKLPEIDGPAHIHVTTYDKVKSESDELIISGVLDFVPPPAPTDGSIIYGN